MPTLPQKVLRRDGLSSLYHRRGNFKSLRIGSFALPQARGYSTDQFFIIQSSCEALAHLKRMFSASIVAESNPGSDSHSLSIGNNYPKYTHSNDYRKKFPSLFVDNALMPDS
jgi:hypothetical protein